MDMLLTYPTKASHKHGQENNTGSDAFKTRLVIMERCENDIKVHYLCCHFYSFFLQTNKNVIRPPTAKNAAKHLASNRFSDDHQCNLETHPLQNSTTQIRCSKHCNYIQIPEFATSRRRQHRQTRILCLQSHE